LLSGIALPTSMEAFGPELICCPIFRDLGCKIYFFEPSV